MLLTARFCVFRALHRELECSKNAPNIWTWSRSATKMFGTDTADWILQENNEPKHRSRHRKWHHNFGLAITVPRCESTRKCLECFKEEACGKTCVHAETALAKNQEDMARNTNGLRWKISGKHAEKVPGYSGQRWGLDYLLGSSAVVLQEYFYFKKNVLKYLIVFEKSRTRSCWTDCIWKYIDIFIY